MDRKYLRKKVIEVLKAKKISGINQDVYPNRSVPTDVHNLPIALVYTKNLTSTRFDEAPKRYFKELQVIIEVVTVHDDDCQLSDELDDLSLAIEDALEDSVELEECVEYINLNNVIYDTESDGQSPVGSVKIGYSIGFVTEPRIDKIYPDFKQINTTWQANGNTDGDAQDQIDMT